MKKIIYAVLMIVFGSLSLHRTVCAQQEGGAIQAVDEVKESSGSTGNSNKSKFQNKANTASTEKKTLTKSAKNRSKSVSTAAIKNSSDNPPKSSIKNNAKYDGFVVGDKYTFLNFEIVERVQPIYTLKAKEAGAAGLVQVEILVGEDGRVLTAKARTGNALLHAEAEKAALATVLNKPEVYGKPARAIGFLVYRFGKSEE